MHQEIHTLVEMLRWRADSQPDAIAYRFTGDNGLDVPLTYSVLDRRARAIGEALRQRGAFGKPVILLYPSGLDFIAAFFGCLYAGAIGVPVYPPRKSQKIAQFRAIMREAGALIVLTASSKKIADIVGEEEVTTIDTNLLSDSIAEAWKMPSIGPDSIAFLQYTSGSTGSPKGVINLHGNVLRNLEMISQAFDLNSSSRGVSWLPMYHDMGLIGGVLQPVYSGVHISLMSPEGFTKRPGNWLKLISESRATVSGGPSFAFDICERTVTEAELRDLDLSTWQVAFNGAEPIRADVLERFARKFERCGFRKEAFFPCYGMAEASLFISGGPTNCSPRAVSLDAYELQHNRVMPALPGKRSVTAVSCGRPGLGVEVQIVDPSTRRRCLPNLVGEIWVSAPSVAAGYWNSPQVTQDVFRAMLADSGGEFLRSGDMGYVHDGELFVTGRLKDMLIVRGRNIYPQDVESVAQRSDPALRGGTAAVFSIVTDDGRECLAVACEVDRKHLRRPNIPRIVAAIRRSVVETHDVAVDVVVLLRPGELPRTSSGKIRRAECKRLLLSEEFNAIAIDRGESSVEVNPDVDPHHSAAGTTRDEGLMKFLLERLSQELKVPIDALNAGHSLAGLGVDSLTAMRIWGDVELFVQKSLSTDLLWDSVTIDHLVRRIEELPPATESEEARAPRITPDAERRFESFALTDVQRAYWLGRQASLDLGSSACHFYCEYEPVGLDVERLTHAWRRVVERHDMLRAIVTNDGQQRVMAHVPAVEIAVVDLRDAGRPTIEETLERVRRSMSHSVRSVHEWPLFDIRVHRLPDGKLRLHLSIDLLVADAVSLLILQRDWMRFYREPNQESQPVAFTFRDWICLGNADVDHAKRRRAADYWMNRLDGLPPPPELPWVKRPDQITKPVFTRRSTRLTPEHWRDLKRRAQHIGVTPTALLCTAFAYCLRNWSKEAHFLLNITFSDRQAGFPGIDQIVGDFTSINLLEVDLRLADDFDGGAQRVQRQLWTDLKHRHMNGVQVAREIAMRQQRTLIAPVVFTSTLGMSSDDDASSWLGERIFSVSQTPQVILDHQVLEEGKALILSWDSVDELFPSGMMDDMFGWYGDFLRTLAAGADVSHGHAIAELPLHQLQQRREVNATAVRRSGRELLHSPFLKRARRSPDALAIISTNMRLSYGQVLRRSVWIASELHRLGVSRNTLVAIAMEKGWEQTVGVLGVLLAGAAYLPIDPTLPRDRCAELLRLGDVKVMLTQSWIDRQWPEQLNRICVDVSPLASSEAAPDVAHDPHDLAYTIFTSGSTGTPKGVMIDHRGAVNTVLEVNQRFSVLPTDRVFALSSLSFDLSVFDIFGTLAAGGTIVVPDESQIRDPAKWLAWLTDERVTVWNSAPALMQLLLEYLDGRAIPVPESLRLVMLSGDWIPVAVAKRLTQPDNRLRVVSLGGATEASIWSNYFVIDEVKPEWKSVPYGKPLANQTMYVLDDRFQHRPVWVPGHIYIGGVGLAQGYRGDPEKTKASFINHPRTGERLYRTGDLGRYLPDGNIEFLGRDDGQIKLQGYRVELGEIETALAQHPAISVAVASAISASHGAKRLVAGIVYVEGAVPVDAGELRAFLETKLPRHMVPSFFRTFARIPLNVNGKVDRAALAKMSWDEALTAPRPAKTHISVRTVESVVQTVLNVPSIEPNASLFELGATSIELMRVANALEQEFGSRIDIAEFFRSPTLAAIAAYYSAKTPKSSVTALPISLPDPEAARSPATCPARTPAAPVGLPLVDEVERQRSYRKARSRRGFELKPISLERFSRLLGAIAASADEGGKRLYGSAGDIYPVQVYLHAKPGRISDLSGGAFYYDPIKHCLMRVQDAHQPSRDVHFPHNRALFDESAFSIYLVAEYSAVRARYGDLSKDLCLLEAGAIGQVLRMSAFEQDIGLCQIGALDHGPIRDMLALSASQELLHSILGGNVEGANAGTDTPPTGADVESDTMKLERLLQRLDGLTEEDSEMLLRAEQAVSLARTVE